MLERLVNIVPCGDLMESFDEIGDKCSQGHSTNSIHSQLTVYQYESGTIGKV